MYGKKKHLLKSNKYLKQIFIKLVKYDFFTLSTKTYTIMINNKIGETLLKSGPKQTPVIFVSIQCSSVILVTGIGKQKIRCITIKRLR